MECSQSVAPELPRGESSKETAREITGDESHDRNMESKEKKRWDSWEGHFSF